MTKHPIEVITAVERRRRWSCEDNERLVAACLEPGAVLSETTRAAGIHVSQLFRWRKELCRIDNAAERALRGLALGRKSWLFAGSDRGADRAAFMATLIMTA